MVEIKVLGTGCRKCNKLYELTRQAASETGVETDLAKVEKLDDIVSYGVMSTPALVINGQVKSTGKIPKPAQIADWIREAAK